MGNSESTKSVWVPQGCYLYMNRPSERKQLPSCCVDRKPPYEEFETNSQDLITNYQLDDIPSTETPCHNGPRATE